MWHSHRILDQIQTLLLSFGMICVFGSACHVFLFMYDLSLWPCFLTVEIWPTHCYCSCAYIFFVLGACRLLTFDASVANAFIVKQEWEGLDDYLGKLVATILKKTILKKTPDEVGPTWGKIVRYANRSKVWRGCFFLSEISRVTSRMPRKKICSSKPYAQTWWS